MWRSELTPLIKLSIPVVLANLGFMFMGLVDTLIIGKVGALELAGVSAGNGMFWFLLIVPSGIFLAMDPLVSGLRGQGKSPKALLTQGLHQAFILSFIFTPILTLMPEMIFEAIGTNPEIIPGAALYLKVMGYSYPITMLGMVLQRYWNAMERPKAIAVLAIGANLINLLLDLTLVLGWFGAPKLGVLGVALASFGSRLLITGGMVWFTLRHLPEDPEPWGWKWDKAIQKQMVRVGVPAMAQWGLEMFAFTLSTMLATRLSAESLSAHQVGMTLASVVFMVPMGLSTGAAVRVGYHLGTGRHDHARYAGWLSTGLGLGFNICTALTFLFLDKPLVRLFITDPEVVEVGAHVLRICGLFQLFDGSQVILAGALRGYQKTTWPLVTNFLGYYPLGLPLGAYLCFYTPWGVPGLWVGLTVGLMTVSLLNVVGWVRLTYRSG